MHVEVERLAELKRLYNSPYKSGHLFRNNIQIYYTKTLAFCGGKFNLENRRPKGR